MASVKNAYLTGWRGAAVFINVDAGFGKQFLQTDEKSSLCEEKNICGEEQIVQKYGLTPLTADAEDSRSC
jgi:hypothetical protein